MNDPTISEFFKGETNTHWLVWAITKGLSFAGGVYIILSGVRLIIGEIVPAFRGIAEKLYLVQNLHWTVRLYSHMLQTLF